VLNEKTKGEGTMPAEECLVKVEKLASRIRERHYSFISDNCLIKSVDFVRRCTKIGAEARVVACLDSAHRYLP